MEEGRRRQQGGGLGPPPQAQGPVCPQRGGTDEIPGQRLDDGFPGPARARNVTSLWGSAGGKEGGTEQKGPHHSGLGNG